MRLLITEKGLASPDEKMRLTEQIAEGSIDMTMGKLLEAFGSADFTNALYDCAQESAMQGFGEVPAYWKPVCKVVPLTTMKTKYLKIANGMGKLSKRLEHEPSTLQKPTDRKESYTPYVYDDIFGISMTAWVNDELNLLKDNFRSWGHSGVHTLNDFVWNNSTGLIGGTGVAMASGNNVFDNTNHANYTSSSGALNLVNLEAAIAAMLSQVDEGGTNEMPIYPTTLNAPAEKEGIAKRLTQSDKLFGTTTADTTFMGERNTVRDYGLKVNIVPNMTSTHWVLSADPNIWPTIEMGFLNGRTEPEITFQRPDSDAQFFMRHMYSKCSLTFGGMVQNPRCFYKSVG